MAQFKNLIKFGEDHKKPPKQNKKNEKKIKSLATYFKSLSGAMRYKLENGQKKPGHPGITDDMNSELSRVFGHNWYQKKYKSWTEKNQRDFLHKFIDEYKLDKNPDGWYTITVDNFKQEDGLGLIDKYNNSIRQLLDKFGQVLHPDHVFYEWKFERIHNWEVPYNPQYPTYDVENTSKYELFKQKKIQGIILLKDEIPLFRRFMDYVMEQEKLTSIYQLRDGIIKKHDGEGLITVNGFKRLVELAYPEITIEWFRMPYVQLDDEYWTSENIRGAFKYYCKIKNISTNNLMTVTNVDLENQGWWKLSKKGSILSLLQIGFPEIEWDPLGVSKIPWTQENKIIALERLAEKQGWKDNSDYYKFTIKLAKQYNLVGLMSCYDNSPIRLLRDLLPDYDWKEWKFSKSNNCWSDGTTVNMDQIRSYFDDYYTENNFQSLDDFAGYSVKDFRQGILIHFKFNLYNCMTSVYPEHNWEEDTFQAVNYSKTSIRLWKELMSIIHMLSLQHKLNGGEVKIGKNPVDAYHRSDTYDDAIDILSCLPSYCMVKKHDTATHIIFQYHGTYWHAHPDYYESSSIHSTKKIECGIIYTNTCRITEELSKTHHVVEIWEHDYMKST